MADAVRRMGLKVYWHQALGDYGLDDKAAVKYADGTVWNSFAI